LEAVRALDPQVLPQVLRGARLCDLPPRDELKALTVPALLLAWVEDATHPLATAEELDALLPESELVIAQGIGAVQRWPEQIREFISSLP
jgi:3-oxoadipate enol-lactonase